MNEIGKKICEIKNDKIIQLNSDWFKIKSKEFPSWMNYSKHYTYLPLTETVQFIENYLKSLNVDFKKYERNYSYQKYVDFIIKKDNLKFLLSIQNSTDKSKALLITFAVMLADSVFKTVFIHRKIHRGEFNFESFMQKFVQLFENNTSLENLKKYAELRDKFQKIEINYELLKKLFDEIPQKIYRPFLNSLYYYFKTNNKISLANALSATYKFYLTHSASKLKHWDKFIQHIIDNLINFGLFNLL